MDMLPLIIAGLTAISILLIAVGIAMSGSGNAVGSRLERYASASRGTEPTADDGNESAVLAGISRVIERRDRDATLSTDLARADLKLRPAEFIIAWAATPFIVVAVAFAIGFVLPAFQTLPALFIFFVLGAFLPRFYLKRRQAKRLKQFDEQLPDTITLLANSLRAGSSFLQGVELVTRESLPPISDEFERVVREMNLGQSLESALNNLVRRVASEDLELMVTAINIQSQVGGNLATVLDAIAFTIRERMRIKGEINTLTAMGRYSGYVITLLPIALGAILFLISPSYMGAMLESPPTLFGLPLGFTFMAVGLFSMFIGYMLIRRIIDVKV